MPRLLKTSEYKIVSDHRWQGGTVTNDAHILKLNGIKSPGEKGLYAKAYSKDGKTEIWLKTPERLEIFKKNTTDINNYTIEILNKP
jgi:ribosomal protein S2